MNNKEAIIQKIIDDANAAAQKNLDEAREKAAQIIGRAQKQADKYVADNARREEQLYKESLQRGEVVAGLDCKKILQGAKKAVIDKAFDEALQAIVADKKLYPALLQAMILSCCESGDEVVVAQSDDKIVTKKLISDLAKKSGKSIKKSGELGDFKGGVILSGEKYDKNLTLELELSVIRERIESKVDEILFGGK